MNANTNDIEQGAYLYYVIYQDMGTRSLHVRADNAAQAKRKAKAWNRGRGTGYSARRVNVNIWA